MVDMTQRLLDSMDGVALILDANLLIVRIGDPNWSRFLDDNRGARGASAGASIEATIGRPIGTFFAGEILQQTFSGLFRRVLDGRRDAIRLDYRCDAPDLRRDMRLAVTLLMARDGARQLLYQSIMLSTESRAPLPLFDADIATNEGPDILTLCAICARVAWPLGAPSGARDWIDPAEYYRRGGAETVSISHGFCEACHARLTEEG